MKKILLFVLTLFISYSVQAQITGTYKISKYNIQNLSENTKDIDVLNFSSFRALIENKENIAFNKDKTLSAPSLKKYFNPRYKIENNEFTFYFGETKEKESFTRYDIKIEGNSFVLSKETPAVKESYTFTKN